MATQHHSEYDEAAQKRFLEETLERYGIEPKREFPNGRISGDDDGAFAYAIATDARHGIIKIAFPHPVGWIGLDADSAERLRDELSERLLELRGIKG